MRRFLSKLGIVLFGLIFAGVGTFMLVTSLQSRSRTTEPVTATVVDYEQRIDENTDSDGFTSKTYSYYPVFRFTYNGEEITQPSDYGSGKREYAMGTQVDILVNPDNPTEIRIKGDNTVIFMTSIFIVAGLGVVALGIFKR